MKRRQLLSTTINALAAGSLVETIFASPTLSSEDRGRAAEIYVSHETPQDTWPFQIPSREELLKSKSKVFFHYFPPFPLSFRNQNADDDVYNNRYMAPSGENKHYLDVGGYIQERPLSPPPWKQPYWRAINFEIDVLRARLTGADGFMVDLLRTAQDGSQESIRDLLGVVSKVANDFWIVPEPDGNALFKMDTSIIQMIDLLEDIQNHSSIYRIPDGRALVTPFSPERYPTQFWIDVVNTMSQHGTPIALMPVFLKTKEYAQAYQQFSYGLSYWGFDDVVDAEIPEENTWRFLNGESRIVMQPISPQSVRPKAKRFWESQNATLFRILWEKAIRRKAPYVQVVTWNDYSESTEVSPSSGIQFVFYDLSAYYISWLKTGVRPKIIRNAVYYLYRTQIIGDSAHDSFHLFGHTKVTNDIEMLAFVTEDALLEIEISGTYHRKNVGAGLQSFKVASQFGYPVFRIKQGSKVVVEKIGEWEVSEEHSYERPLYVGGSSNRPFYRRGP